MGFPPDGGFSTRRCKLSLNEIHFPIIFASVFRAPKAFTQWFRLLPTESMFSPYNFLFLFTHLFRLSSTEGTFPIILALVTGFLHPLVRIYLSLNVHFPHTFLSAQGSFVTMLHPRIATCWRMMGWSEDVGTVGWDGVALIWRWLVVIVVVLSVCNRIRKR